MKKSPVPKQNWFPTLNDALASEELLEAWDVSYPPIMYEETRQFIWQDGSRYGHKVSIYRNSEGMYERPVHYRC